MISSKYSNHSKSFSNLQKLESLHNNEYSVLISRLKFTFVLGSSADTVGAVTFSLPNSQSLLSDFLLWGKD